MLQYIIIIQRALMQKVKIDAKTIQKTVKISQAIEGYKSADKKIVEEVKKIREKYAIKVSLRKK